MIKVQFEVEQNRQGDPEGTILIVRLDGMVPLGSKGNDTVLRVANEIQKHVEQLVGRSASERSPVAGVILDCLHLRYTFGDVLGTLWLLPMKHHLQCAIVARGETRANIESLVRHSLSVPIVESEEEAVRILRPTA